MTREVTGKPNSIPRTLPAAAGLSYSGLRAEGTRLVQAMSGQIWTDYNYSDPGVTILEQLCYALTELSFRADFPVADLLGAPATGAVALWRQALYPARAIMPINPVTSGDLRRLIIDRVPGVGNAWFTPCPPAEVQGVSGLYRLSLLVPSQDPCCSGNDDRLKAIVERARTTYAAHRALCEDVESIVLLAPLATVVEADVQLDDGADPNAVMARLLFGLGLRLAPEPKRAPLDALLAAGRTTSEIFTGPLMLRGFIADEQLTPFPAVMPVDDLLQTMAETAGVLSVPALSVRIDGDPRTYAPGDLVSVPEGRVLWLAEGPCDGSYPIRLWRGDVLCQPNPGKVRRRLDRLWAAQRRTYDLWPEYARHYAPPRGRSWNPAAYSSVQDQFPLVYGIGEYGLPSNAPASRQARAKQLKGYLMVFDQLMANYFSQLAFLRHLFSITTGGGSTYAWQSLEHIVPDAAPLLRPDYREGLERLVAADDPVAARQSAILDLLLSLYAESLTAPAHAACSCGGDRQQTELVEAKRALLARTVPATRDRGRGFDYLRPQPGDGIAGLEVRARIELAVLDASLHGNQPQMVADPGDADFGRRLTADETTAVERDFLPITPGSADIDGADDHGAPLTGRRITAALWPALADARRYRIGLLYRDGAVCLTCRDNDGVWWLLGEHSGVAEAIAAADRLIRTAGGRHTQLTIVEWTLLRYAMHGPWDEWQTGGQGHGNHRGTGGTFSFRVSAVLAVHEDERRDAGWRSGAEAILRANVPAHIVLDCLFLDHRRLRRFRRLYEAWAEALRAGPPGRRAETSRRLAHFLDEAAPRPVPTPAPAPSAAPPPTATPAPTSPPSPAPDPTPEPEPPPIEPAAEPMPMPAATAQTTSETRQQVRFPPRRAPAPGVTPAPEQAPEPSEPTPDAPPERRWWQFWRRSKATPPPPTKPPAPPDQTAADSPDRRTASLAGRVVAATPGAAGFDTDTVLTAATARAFAADGFQFAIRYLSRDAIQAGGDLTDAEAEDILQAGLALMAVQHVAPAGWTPSGKLGRRYGLYAAINARRVGLPSGVTLWLDLEGVAAGTPADRIIDYCDTWADVVTDAGYVAGLYVGADCGLTGEQIATTRTRYFWRSGSTVPDVPGRGYCLLQTIAANTSLDGVAYDDDAVQTDRTGNTPFWLTRAPPAATPPEEDSP